MIKKILLIFILIPISFAARSQALLAILFGNKLPANDNLTLGVYFGPQFTNLTNTDGSDTRTSLAFGAYTNIKMSEKWTLSNYMIFKSPRGAVAVPLAYQLQANVPDADKADIKRKITFFELSPLMRHNLSPSFSVAAGPQISFRTLAKDIYRITLPDGGKEEITYKTRDKYRLLDVAVAADFQYAFDKGKGLRLNFRYSYGLTNIYQKDVPMHAKNQYLQVGLGIPIAIGKK
ncbi:outer membrane beta-barrel protein [Pedobacter sp. MW01-1-1]|uniref:outer membrane beta-barrel protein n=1 Tax=Pedobacter sp. MW01-1-1 TaxID=3383027 RepID=UPI003FEFDE36